MNWPLSAVFPKSIQYETVLHLLTASRIVARIEELTAKIQEAAKVRADATRGLEALPSAELARKFHEFAKSHRSGEIGDMLVEAGYGTSTKCESIRVKGSVPVLRIPNVASERINLADLKFGILTEAETARVTACEGDLLVVRTNGSLDLVGRCAMVPHLSEPTAFASYLIRLRLDSRVVSPEYAQLMLHHLRTGGSLIDLARTTAGQYNVSLGRLRSARIPVPPLPEQRRIVAYLDNLQAKVDALKRLQAETATELDALLPSILDRAFRGDL